MNKSFWKFFAGFVIPVVMVMGASETAYASESDDEETPAETIIFDEEEDLDGDISDFFVPGYELPEGLRDKVGQGEPAEQQVIWEPKYEWEFDLITGSIAKDMSNLNRYLNRRLEKDFKGYIDNQATCPDFYIGTDSRMSNVGCELAAVYNALMFHNVSAKMSDIIYEAEQDGYIMLKGAAGTNPYKLGELINAVDISDNLRVTQYRTFDEFYNKTNQSFSQDRIFIVSFWNSLLEPKRGVHTIAIYTKKRDNHLYALNLRAYEEEQPVQINCIDEICDRNTFVVGYWIY